MSSDRDKLIAEARQLTECHCSYGDGPLQECGTDGDHISQLIANLADALEATVAELVRDTPEDTEWEYGTSWLEGDRRTYGRSESMKAATDDLARMNLGYDYPEENFLVRRKSATQWIPFTPTSKDEKGSAS